MSVVIGAVLHRRTVDSYMKMTRKVYSKEICPSVFIISTDHEQSGKEFLLDTSPGTNQTRNWIS